ncbi:EscU/YscU/HrcU family type III secretion system export apparatus switch protein [Oryzibacter oryziterrae]|uniref:EscU/YscU/HrcU family type III secretion system export apparatus switch protein n=1 Tax=Oryzibacter oryziterrae TaxID=2766474 RepID=UPI001F0120B2|nr:EscU/YscU/HrcU family type III secretion system export apparatus switch protein [Oryzibacter oryziterrae]
MNGEDIRKAVALTYTAPAPPKVVATGKGEIADAIVAKAREAGVPIEENPLLAEALSKLELDATIPEDLYKAVAAVIGAILRASWKS